MIFEASITISDAEDRLAIFYRLQLSEAKDEQISVPHLSGVLVKQDLVIVGTFTQK